MLQKLYIGTMPDDLKGWIRPRPIRVAFLVQEGENAQIALDGIFADCYYRWGGRFSLIVPCREERIVEAYWPWLEAYDADIVYSYVPLCSDDVLEIHERLSPSLYKFHDLGPNPRLDVHGFKPSYGFNPLSSMSTIFRLARYGRLSPGAPIKIIDSWHTERPSLFLSDNFGTYHASQGGSIFPVDATAAATLLTIVSPDRQANRQYGVPQNLDAIPDEATAFRYLAEGRAASLSLASAIVAPKLDIGHGQWTGSFNLVVGESFEDRMIFWNGRLFIPGWLDNDLCCARVTLSELRDEVFLSTLGEFIKRHNRVNAGSGGQPQLTIRSVSQTVTELEEARALLMSTSPWSVIRTESVPSVDTLVPAAHALNHARESNQFSGSLVPHPNWKAFSWSPPSAQPPASVPDHLADAPSRQIFTQGYWAEDLMFECDGPLPRGAQENCWTLPQRWRMAGAFAVKQTAGWAGLLPRARRSRGGSLGVYVSADYPVESVNVPSAADAIIYALAVEGRWAKHAAKDGELLPENKVVWARPSNEAGYLAGVLGMTGGFARAREALLHPFLQVKFAQLGGTPNVPPDKISPTVGRLKKKALRNPTFNLKDELDTNALAELIIKAGRELKNPLDFLKYEHLKEDWKTYREGYWTRHTKPHSTEQDEWDRHEEESLDLALIEMRRRKMLFQGHRWICRTCHHRNWVDFAALSSLLTCEVCTRTEQAPVDIRWLFRPNEFLIESLRDHSVLPLIWALAALSDRARRSFIFVGPTCFGFTEDEINPSAEIDLMVIVDGITMLCEVKSSWRFRPVELTEFVTLAVRLRPDVALFAVMDPDPGPMASLAEARARLEACGMKFEVLTPNEVMLRDSTYLDLS